LDGGSVNDWEREALITAASTIQDRIDSRIDGEWKRHRSPLEQVSAHEAAHVVCAFVLEKRVEYVTVKPAGTTLGHVQFATTSSKTEEEHVAWLNSGPTSPKSARQSGSSSSVSKATPKPGFREARAAVRKFLAHTEALLRANRRCVDALASELAERGTLTGGEDRSPLSTRL